LGGLPHETPKRARLSIDENGATLEAPPETVPQCSQQEGPTEDHLSEEIEASEFDVGGDVQMLDSDDKCSSCFSLKMRTDSCRTG